MIENTILKANREGRKALVFSMTYKDLWAVEAAAQAGFDAVSLDGEHGAFSSSDVDDIVRVANGYGMSVMARVPNIEPNTINLWLDRGIQGVVGPHIETQQQSQQLADACLFPPDGQHLHVAARRSTTRMCWTRSTAASSASPRGPTGT